jgi:hypothetical protein
MDPKPTAPTTETAKAANTPAPPKGVSRTVHVNWYAIELEKRRIRNLLDSEVRVFPFDNISESVVEASGLAFEVRGDTIVVLDKFRGGAS